MRSTKSSFWYGTVDRSHSKYCANLLVVAMGFPPVGGQASAPFKFGWECVRRCLLGCGEGEGDGMGLSDGVTGVEGDRGWTRWVVLSACADAA